MAKSENAAAIQEVRDALEDIAPGFGERLRVARAPARTPEWLEAERDLLLARITDLEVRLVNYLVTIREKEADIEEWTDWAHEVAAELPDMRGGEKLVTNLKREIGKLLRERTR